MSDELKLGCILPVPDEATATPLPLQHTGVTARITGAMAQVTVQQRFGNPLTEVIAVRYLFPLPHEAAVVDYTITIGTRTIKAQMQEREAARRTYEEAAQQGQRASLLEQQRPNLFTIEIANVQPGETILTEVVYEERLKYEDGAYEFVFPMGITPRYHSRKIVQMRSTAEIDAPVTADNTDVGPVEIKVILDAGVPLTADPTSRTHPITLTREGARHVSLALEGKHIPNKDFVLRYKVSSDKMQSAAWSSKSDDGDTALLMLIPPRLDLNDAPAPREFIFVIDRSGSMIGEPIQQAVNALKACLRALSEQDTFLIQAFDDKVEWFDQKPRPVTQANINAADTWLNSVDARGGTEIMGAIQASLSLPVDQERQRYVVFLTDGAVSADEQAIAQIAKQRGNARIFSFGIGPSVNRYLLSKMAQMGRGVAEFLGAQDDIEGALTRFQDRVSYPALLDLSLSWQNATAWDTYPSSLPDLYIGQPLEISTRLKRTGEASAIATGKARGQDVTFYAPLPAATESNPTIERLHARARIESLMDEATKGGDTEKIRRQVISLAIEHRLMTPYTSFVAVDNEKTNSTGGKEVDVAVPLPEGLKMEGFFGEQDTGNMQGIIATGALRKRLMNASLPPSTSMSFYAAPPPPSPVTPSPAVPPLARALSDYDNMSSEELNKMIDASPWSVRHSPKHDAYAGGSDANSPISMSREEAQSAMSDMSESEQEKGAAPEEAKPGMLSNFIDRVTGRKDKEPESRTTEHFLDEMYKPDAPKQDGPLEGGGPLSHEDNLKVLARTQNVNGSWQDEVEITAAALLAFIRAGHTTRKGQYRRQAQKAMTWLLSQLPSTRGFAAFAALRALDDLYGETGDGEVPDSVRHSLPAAASDAERAAMGEQMTVSQTLDNLDAVRVAALVQGNVRLTMEHLQSDEGMIAQVWALVGAPKG